MIKRLSFFVVLLPSHFVFADGIKIDKVYDPYVQLSEREIEMRSNFYHFEDGPNFGSHKLGIGYGFAPSWFAEVYAVGVKAYNESLTLEAVELETKWQMTEQGEYGADWGALFELEDKRHTDSFELASTLITAKDFGRWTAVSNVGLAFEWGESINNEFETTFAGQLRYRLQASFEPGFEIYLGQNTRGVGPVFQGQMRSSGRKSLQWEAGVIVGMVDATPDYTFRLQLEFEF